MILMQQNKIFNLLVVSHTIHLHQHICFRKCLSDSFMWFVMQINQSSNLLGTRLLENRRGMLLFTKQILNYPPKKVSFINERLLNYHVIFSERGVYPESLLAAGPSPKKSLFIPYVIAHGPNIIVFLCVFPLFFPQSPSLVWSPSSSIPLRWGASIRWRAASIRGPTRPFEPPHSTSLCTLHTQNCGLGHAAEFELQRGVGPAVAAPRG